MFSDVKFDKGAIFKDTKLAGGVDFAETEFRGPGRFLNTKFIKDAAFYKTLFFERTTFSGAEINEGIRFLLTEFGIRTFKEVTFDHAFIVGGCEFVKSIFHGEVSFQSSVFKGITLIEETEFRENADFYGTEFNGKVYFKNIGKLAKKRTTLREEIVRGATEFIDIAPNITFSNVSLSPYSTLFFENFDLGDCSFADTPAISEANFKKVLWLGNGKPKRKHTRDEVLAERGSIHYEIAAEVYRRLRKNFEDRLSYADAGDFHIGEMHMRRLGLRQKGWKRFFILTWVFLHLYRIFGGYGESLRNPIISFIAVGFVFAGLWSLLGFPIPIGNKVIISHNPFYAILFSFKTFLTLPGKPFCLVQEFVGAFQRAIGVGIITLFILALRRAFRR